MVAALLGLAHAAPAPDNNPLRPPDTSSPRATVQGFVETMDDVYRRMNGVLESYRRSDRLYLSHEERKAQAAALTEALRTALYLDLSHIPPVLKGTETAERIVQLKEIFDRIQIPPSADMPDQEQMAHAASKRWRIPDTEIDVALVESGPRAGEYLISAATIDRLPEFYNRVKHLPYRPGPGKQLDDLYRTISQGASSTIYDGLLNSPGGLSYIIPPRWMLNLPQSAKVQVLGVAGWQWLGLGVSLIIGALIIIAASRVGHPRVSGDQVAPPQRWRAVALPLAIMIVAGLLVLQSDVLRIGGTPRIVLAYLITGTLYVAAAWAALAISVMLGEVLVASERLAPRSLDSQLTRLGARLIGLVAAIAILIRSGDELGFPAYSVLAGLGVGGLAVALAAQSTIANLIGSMLIVMEKPFRVGHLIRVSGSEGTVEDVGFRSTRIRTADNTLVSIPSSTVANTTVENLSLRTKRRQRFLVQVTYDTPRDKLEDLVAGIRQLIVENPAAERATCQVRFNNFGESSLDILVNFHLLVNTYSDEIRERETILLGIMDVVKDAGLELAFPTRTLHLASVSESISARSAPVPSPIGFATRS